MNILYFIGNGFDLNLGMPTKFSDFYNYYKKIESKNNIIQDLKNNIESDYKSWADLEIAIGKYTDKIKNQNDFDTLFIDIVDNLGNYLSQIEKEFEFGHFDKNKLYNYFNKPENSLPKADTDVIKDFKQNWQSNWNIDIVTLNYTRSLEKIINNPNNNLIIGKRSQNNSIILRSISHLHGDVDDSMVLGVNDTSQISNTNFHTNQDILESLVKSDCNQALKHTIDINCKSLISSANLICIFGSSIGDTDKCWWELIGERIKKNGKLIIFTKGEEINKRTKHITARVERDMKDLFLNKTKLSPEEKELAKKNIYIGVNTDMFNDLEI
jgi:hypothetical protein